VPTRPARQKLSLQLMKRFGLFTRDDRVFLMMVPIVGLATGLLAVAITTLMRWTSHLVWGESVLILKAAQNASWQRLLLAPVLGGVAIGVVALVSRLPLRTTGTSTLMEAVALHGGYLDTARSIASQIVAVITVGVGGSAGREGPLTASGATFASKVGRTLGLSRHPLKILVGCGTAAGMAAAYNAPIGGALFAMEVVLGNFALDIFGPIVISSVIATLISRALIHQGHSVYVIEAMSVATMWELLLFVLLGVACGLLSLLFIRAMEWGDRLFEAIPVPSFVKPTLGFAAVGAIGILTPHVYGNGYETVNMALGSTLVSDMDVRLLLLLPLVKLVATALTIGSGGAGGLFTPSLFIGALAGTSFGVAVHSVLGAGTSEISLYALIGMGAIAAATTHAPISTIFIIYEMTDHNYSVILPLMAACAASSVVGRAFEPHSLFTARLARRGIELPHRLEEIVMETMTARDVVREDRLTLRPKDAMPEIFHKFMETRRNHLYVHDKDKAFLGAVSLHDLKQIMLQSSDMGFMLAIDIMHADFPSVLETDRLSDVMKEFAEHDQERLPVLDGVDSRKLVGFVTKRDLMAVYNQEVLRRPSLLAKFQTDRDEGEQTTYVELPPRYRVEQLTIGPALEGRTLAELNLPAEFQTHVLEVKRTDDAFREYRVIPGGATALASGDRLVVLGLHDQIDRLRELYEPKD